MAIEDYKFSTLDLEVLAILSNSRRPVRYIEFVNKPDRNLLTHAMDLTNLGLVKKLSVDDIRERGYSVEELCDGFGDVRDVGVFYEISDHGKYIVSGMLNYVNNRGSVIFSESRAQS